jgi:hypothetical protein
MCQAKIYSKYEYLNSMADNWVGIVLNDYEAVFPVCYRRKLGITYCYTPAFIQHFEFIGIDDNWNKIKKSILEFVSFGDIMLNHYSTFEHLPTKANFILNLNNSYETIFNNYKSDLKQNLKKAAKENLIYIESNDVKNAIELYKKIYSSRMGGTNENDFANFAELCNTFHQTGNCIIREVKNSNNNLLATTLLLKDNHRLYNLANSTTDLGRKTEANHFLMDRILNEFAGTNMIFDFEGSDLPGVKTFYQKFGAINEPYFHWHFNHLPWWIKWAKK